MWPAPTWQWRVRAEWLAAATHSNLGARRIAAWHRRAWRLTTQVDVSAVPSGTCALARRSGSRSVTACGASGAREPRSVRRSSSRMSASHLRGCHRRAIATSRMNPADGWRSASVHAAVPISALHCRLYRACAPFLPALWTTRSCWVTRNFATFTFAPAGPGAILLRMSRSMSSTSVHLIRRNPRADALGHARFLAQQLGVPWAESGVGPFSPVHVNDGLTLDRRNRTRPQLPPSSCRKRRGRLQRAS